MGVVLSSLKSFEFPSKSYCKEENLDLWENEKSISKNNNAQKALDYSNFHEQNPGAYEELYKPSRDILIQHLDGFKFTMNSTINSSLQGQMNFTMGGESPSRFYGGLTYVGEERFKKFENYPLLMAEMDTTLNLNATFVHYIAECARIRFQGQTKANRWENVEGSLVYYGRDCSTSLSLVNPDFSAKNGAFSIQYLKKIKPRLDVGTECLIQSINGNLEFIGPSVAIRYSHGLNLDRSAANDDLIANLESQSKGTAFASLALSNVHLYYQRHIGSGFQMLSSFEYNPALPYPGIFTLSYLAQIPKTGISVKASVDSSWTVGTSVEKKFENFPASFSLNLAHNYSANRAIVGIGLTVGQ